VNDLRARAQALDAFKRRTQADLDMLREITRLVPPPGWVNGFDLSRSALQLSGEVEQADPLLKAVDSSPRLQGAEFTTPLMRVGALESFRLKASREGQP
jgi:hypothetical protein